MIGNAVLTGYARVSALLSKTFQSLANVFQ